MPLKIKMHLNVYKTFTSKSTLSPQIVALSAATKLAFTFLAEINYIHLYILKAK